MIFAGEVLYSLLLPPSVAWAMWCLMRQWGQNYPVLGGWLFSAVLAASLLLLTGDHPGAIGASLSGVIAAIIWWRTRRRDRKRALALLGNKGRAWRAALVRKMRELRKPRPVLRPVPGGAR